MDARLKGRAHQVPPRVRSRQQHIAALADARCGDPPASGRSMTAAQQRTDPGREELAITSPTGTSGFSCALGGSVVMPWSVGDSAPCL